MPSIKKQDLTKFFRQIWKISSICFNFFFSTLKRWPFLILILILVFSYFVEVINQSLSNDAESEQCHLFYVNKNKLSEVSCDEERQSAEVVFQAILPKHLNPSQSEQQLAISLTNYLSGTITTPITLTVEAGSSILFIAADTSNVSQSNSTELAISRDVIEYSSQSTDSVEHSCSSLHQCHLVFNSLKQTKLLTFRSYAGLKNGQWISFHVAQARDIIKLEIAPRWIFTVALHKLTDASFVIGPVLGLLFTILLAISERTQEWNQRNNEEIRKLVSDLDGIMLNEPTERMSLLRELMVIAEKIRLFPSHYDFDYQGSKLPQVFEHERFKSRLLVELGNFAAIGQAEIEIAQVIWLFGNCHLTQATEQHLPNDLFESIKQLVHLQKNQNKAQRDSSTDGVSIEDGVRIEIVYVKLLHDIWMNYGELSRNLVVKALIKLLDFSTSIDVEDIVSTKFLKDKTHEPKSLIRDPRLNWSEAIYRQSVIEYHWPSVSLPPSASISQTVAEWIESSPLQRHPFVINHESDADVLESVFSQLAVQREQVIVCADGDIRIALASNLFHRLQKTYNETKPTKNLVTFPIWCPIFSADFDNILESIGHHLAQMWLHLIVRNRFILYELSLRGERELLVSLLLWHTGSWKELELQIGSTFRRVFVPNIVERTKSEDIKIAKRSLTILLMHLKEYGDGQTIHEYITWQRLESWLHIRPMYWTGTLSPIPTCTIMIPVEIGRSQNFAAIETQLVNLWQHSKVLAAQNIYLKLFIPPQIEHPFSPAILPTWSDRDLNAILEQTLRDAGIGTGHLNELFDSIEPSFYDVDYQAKFVALANGSLETMLTMGREMIAHHVQRAGDISYLEEADWTWLTETYGVGRQNNEEPDENA